MNTSKPDLNGPQKISFGSDQSQILNIKLSLSFIYSSDQRTYVLMKYLVNYLHINFCTIKKWANSTPMCKKWEGTIVFTMSEIWLEFLGDFGEKPGRLIRKNMTENGPQLIRIDLCSELWIKVVRSEVRNITYMHLGRKLSNLAAI